MDITALVVDQASDILGIQLRASDDYFARGADSLDTLELLTRLQDQLGFEIPAHLIYDGSSLEDFASMIGRVSRRDEPA
ncbi:acyl carrier protein [Microbacterium foliorum]|uniref:acyl carrier protein n=1 Tax=Microbacterium foliorum TaxID=104336 RepID=UPI0028D67AA9|nr:acyl carrier protein [Microbacterium foliorum]